MRNDNEYNDNEYVDITETENQYDDISSNSEPLDDDDNKNQKPRTSVVVFEWVQSMMNAIIVVIILFTFIVRIINVDGGSMMNTLLDGDKVLVTSYSQQYSYGDIIVISRGEHLDKVLIKRVIATEGQIVDIDTETGKVSVDNVVLDEASYTKDGLGTFNLSDTEFPVTVPEGKLFVLGDNRAISKDSRNSEVGFIDVDNVIGKAQLIIYPYNRFGMID